TDRVHSHEHLTQPSLRRRHLFQTQDFHPAKFVNLNCFHQLCSYLGWIKRQTAQFLVLNSSFLLLPSSRRMGSKAIHAHAPILPPHVYCSDDRNPCRCVEHCREGNGGNFEVAVQRVH